MGYCFWTFTFVCYHKQIGNSQQTLNIYKQYPITYYLSIYFT